MCFSCDDSWRDEPVGQVRQVPYQYLRASANEIP